MHRRWWYFAVWLGVVVAIIAMADTGHLRWITDILKKYPNSDKVAHFCLIGVLGFLFNHALGLRKLGPVMLGSLIIAIGMTAEEVSQRWIPGRNFDFGDMAANLAGCVAADLSSRMKKRKA